MTVSDLKPGEVFKTPSGEIYMLLHVNACRAYCKRQSVPKRFMHDGRLVAFESSRYTSISAKTEVKEVL